MNTHIITKSLRQTANQSGHSEHSEESFISFGETTKLLCAFVAFLPSRSTFVQLRGKEHAISSPFPKSPCLPKNTFSTSREPTLRSALIELIENKNATLFLVGNHGNFDTMVRHQLDDLSKIYPIKYFVVLAYMPNRKQPFDIEDEHTVLPEGIENVPYRFAIDYHNPRMKPDAMPTTAEIQIIRIGCAFFIASTVITANMPSEI